MSMSDIPISGCLWHFGFDCHCFFSVAGENSSAAVNKVNEYSAGRLNPPPRPSIVSVALPIRPYQRSRFPPLVASSTSQRGEGMVVSKPTAAGSKPLLEIKAGKYLITQILSMITLSPVKFNRQTMKLPALVAAAQQDLQALQSLYKCSGDF